MKHVLKIKHIFDKTIEAIALIMLTTMVVIISIQVFSRYFFDYTPRWSEEMSLILMVWFGFIGIAVGFRENLHIAIEVFYNKFPKVVKIFVDLLKVGLVIVVGVVFVYQGTIFTILMSESTMAGTKLPSSVLYAVVPVSGLLMVIYGIESFIKSKGKQEKIVGDDE